MNSILLYPYEIARWRKDPSYDTSHNTIVIEIPISDYRAQHMIHTLKVKEEQILQSGIIGESKGQLYIKHTGDINIEAIYTPFAHHQKTNPYNIHLIVGHLRPPVMARVIKDMCGMGVRSIFVHNADLTEKSYMNASMWKETDTLLLLGAMQGGIITLPHLTLCYSIEDAMQKQAAYLQSLCPNPTEPYTMIKIVCDKDYEKSYIRFMYEQLSICRGSTSHIILCIGAERGYTERELRLLESKEFVGLSMGESILRSEVAIHIATGIITALI